MTDRKSIGNKIFIIVFFALLMLNWNEYSLLTKMQRYNPLIFAVLLIALFLCYCNIKDTIKDKNFWLVVVINAVSCINLFLLKSSPYVEIVLFDLTLMLYLSDKISFSFKELSFLVIFIAFFFVYWTVDVKGYFKGYSTNYGGLVLLSGFMFFCVILQYLKQCVIKSTSENKIIKFLQKYRFYMFFAEIGIFIWGYKIMSWYQSRTAFFCMLVLGALLLLPDRFVMDKRICYPLTALIVMGGLFAPAIYVFVGNRVDTRLYKMFYKPVFGYRHSLWSNLVPVIKTHPISGIGTLYMHETPPFREGLLDTLNSYVNMIVVHGVIVAGLVFVLLFTSIIKVVKNNRNTYLSKALFAGTTTLLVAAYAEDYINTVPFMSVFGITLFVFNSLKARGFEEADDDIKYLQELFKGEYCKRFVRSFVPLLFIAFLYFVFGPLEVFYANVDEFMFNASAFSLILTSSSLIVAFLLALLLASIPNVIAKIVIALLSGIGVASYIQYMFMNPVLMSDFGEMPTASDVGPMYYISAVIFVAIIIVYVVIIKFERFQDIAYLYVPTFLTAMMFIAMVYLIVMSQNVTKKEPYVRVFMTDEQFEVAKDENIIVIMLDTLSRDCYSEIIERWPDREEILHDFTYYDKADSEYVPTYPSFIHLLTAKTPDESLSKSEYEREAFSSERAEEFYRTLHERGYENNLYTREFITGEYLDNKFDNAEVYPKIDRKNAIIKLILKQTMFRYVPYGVKGIFEWTLEDVLYTYDSEDMEYYNDNYRAYDMLKANGVSVDEDISKRYIFHHFFGAHSGVINDENCNRVPMNSVSEVEGGAGSLIMVEEYFNRLKEVDKYDSSTIIVMADHGANSDPLSPIFMVKRKNETHDTIQYNHADFKYRDFNKLILELAQ